MSDNIDVSATIKVVDEASGPIGVIENAFGRMAQQAQRVGNSFRTAINQGAFGGLANNVRNVGGAFGRLRGALHEILVPLAAIAGITGGIGIAESINQMKEFASTATQLGRTAPLFGITVERLDALHYAAGRVGVSVEEFDKALAKADLNLNRAASGKNKDLALLFHRLGIAIKDSAGHLKPAATLLDQFANALAKQTNVGIKRDMITTFFGKGGQDLLKLLNQGSAGLEKFVEAAKEAGIITGEDVVNAKAYGLAQRGLKDSMHDLSDEISRVLLPALTPLVQFMSETLRENKKEIIDGITEALKAMSEAVRSVDWKDAIKSAEEWIALLYHMTQAIGGFKTVLIGLALVITGPLISALVSLGIAFAELSVAMLSNPIGITILAIAALAYVLWHEWDKISANFINMWADIKMAFDVAAEWLVTFTTQWLPDAIEEAWAPFGAFFAQLWEMVKTEFNAARDSLAQFVTDWVPGPILTAWAAASAFFSEWWADQKRAFDLALSWFNAFTAAFTPDAIKQAWDGLGQFFTDMWAGIKATFDAAIGWIGSAVDTMTNAVKSFRSIIPGFGPSTPATPAPATPQQSGQLVPTPAPATPQQFGQLVPPAATPSSYSADIGQLIPQAVSSGAVSGARDDAKVDVNVAFSNAPPGLRTSIDTDGPVRATGNVGNSMLAPA